MERGEIWWASLPESTGSMPGFRRPILIIQPDFFNVSQIQTVIAAAITSNLQLMIAPGNVFLDATLTKPSRLPRLINEDRASNGRIERLHLTLLRQL